MHLRVSQRLIKILKTEENEGFVEITRELSPEVRQMFKDAYDDEVEWGKYLFEEGPIVGLNMEILQAYMKHITNVRLRAIGEAPMFPKEECEDLPFMNRWLGKDRNEELPQEIDTSEYKIGIVEETSAEDWDELVALFAA